LVSPIDSYTPANSSNLNGNVAVTFNVNEVLPIPNTLVNSWKLNNTTLSSTSNSLTLSPAQLITGLNTLIFSVTDNTSLIKVTGHSAVHFATVTWKLNKTTTLKISDVKAEERRFGIYPNPAENEFYIKGKQDFSKNVKVALYDGSGRLIPVKFEMNNQSTIRVNITTIPTGTYTLSVADDNGLIISQKIIKE
jgi:hypothetical protein